MDQNQNTQDIGTCDFCGWINPRALFRTMCEALLTVLCIAMCIVALCSVFEGWLL